MNDLTRILVIILVVSVCTFLTRVFPFVIFRKQQEISPVIKYLGTILPMAVMGILVVYCLKGMNFFSVNSFLPSIIAVGTVVVIHVWKRNNLISIGIGTLTYMILLQLTT